MKREPPTRLLEALDALLAQRWPGGEVRRGVGLTSALSRGVEEPPPLELLPVGVIPRQSEHTVVFEAEELSVVDEPGGAHALFSHPNFNVKEDAGVVSAPLGLGALPEMGLSLHEQSLREGR